MYILYKERMLDIGQVEIPAGMQVQFNEIEYTFTQFCVANTFQC